MKYRWFQCAQPLWGDTVPGCMVRNFRYPETQEQVAQGRMRGVNWAGEVFRVRNLPSPLQTGKEAERGVAWLRCHGELWQSSAWTPGILIPILQSCHPPPMASSHSGFLNLPCNLLEWEASLDQRKTESSKVFRPQDSPRVRRLRCVHSCPFLAHSVVVRALLLGQDNWVQILHLPLTSCVTLTKFFNPLSPKGNRRP